MQINLSTYFYVLLFICPCKFQDNFHIFCSSAGGFYQLMSAAWYTEKTDRWGQWWYKRMFCRMGLGFHKALSKSRLFIDPRTQNVLNGVYAWWHQTSIFHHRASRLKWKFHRENNTKVQFSQTRFRSKFWAWDKIMSKILLISKCHINTT